MSNTFDGYVSDILYDDHFYKDLTPNHLEAALLLHNLSLPSLEKGEPFRYLELGYGQGMSLNIHAASHPGEFWGTDFTPNHCLSARDLRAHSGAKCNILNDSFEELAVKAKAGLLPQFDVIALHGVWSWITPESREAVLEIVAYCLKVGGAVYVSYNSMPGWTDFAPLRELLTYHAKTKNASKNSVSKVQEAYNFVSQLEKSGSQYFARNPGAAQKLKSLSNKTVSYVAHEYLNENWYIPYFKDVATDFEQAKCTFVTSTRLLNQLSFALPENMQKMLQGIDDLKLRETVRDFALNTQFRTDIFVKGTKNLSSNDSLLQNASFALCTQKEAVPYTITVSTGQFNLKEDLYKPLVEFFARDNYKPKDIASIKKAFPEMSDVVIREAIAVLIGSNVLHLAKSAKKEQQLMTKRLNGKICERAMQGAAPNALASPVLGGGVAVSPVEMFILVAIDKGNETIESQVDFVYNMMKEKGRNLVKEGKPVEGDKMRDELTDVCTKFNNERLALLKGLMVEILL